MAVESASTAARPGASRGDGEPLSHVDYAWLRMDEPTNLMMIHGVLLFEEPLELDRLRATIEERLLRIPRFRQRVVFPAGRGRPRWEADPDFDLDNHLCRLELTDPGDDLALQELVSRVMASPPDYGRPLWKFYLVDNYKGGSALLARLHHCIADGIALMLVLLSLTDTEPATPEPRGSRLINPLSALFDHASEGLDEARELAERILPQSVRLMVAPAAGALGRTARHVGKGLAAFSRLTFRRPDPKTRFKGPLSVEKRVAWSDPVPIEEVKRVKEAMGGTLNDVLTSVLAGGLRHYLAEQGERVEGLNFRAAVPVNLRRLDRMAELGNWFGLVFLSLPVGIEDPVERLSEMRRRMNALKSSAESAVVYAILGILGRSPRLVQRFAVRLFGAKATAVMTNVPGPRQVLYLAGKPIRGIMFWVPQSGHLGMGISIFSYAGEVRLGVATDAGLVPDPDRVIAGFHAEFEEMLRLAREGRGASAAAEPGS